LLFRNNSTVEFDTFSSDILLPQMGCVSSPGCTTHQRFNANRSTTFTTAGQPFEVDFSTGSGVAPSDNETAQGVIANDTVSIGGLAVQKQGIALTDSQTPGFGQQPFDGMFGLGPSGGSAIQSKPFVVSLLEAKMVDQPVVGFYTSPMRTKAGAQLTLGGVDTTKTTGPLVSLVMNAPLVAKFNVFIADFNGIAVNGKQAGMNGSVFFDTGTSSMVAPTNDDALRVYAMISPKIKLVDPLGGFAMPCSDVNSTNAVLDFAMGGVNFRIPSEELSVGRYPGLAGMCQTVINGGGVGVPGLWTIGNTMLKYYYNAWDVQKIQLSLAPTVQSPKGAMQKIA
jgi:hypothetical protein